MRAGRGLVAGLELARAQEVGRARAPTINDQFWFRRDYLSIGAISLRSRS